jgi:hypothetical protein
MQVIHPEAAGWLGLKLLNLVRFVRLIKIQRQLAAYLVSPWAHLGSITGLYMLCTHCLACVLFFVGRWQLLNLEGGGPNDFVGVRS